MGRQGAQPRGSSRRLWPGRERSAPARTVSACSRTTRSRTVAVAAARSRPAADREPAGALVAGGEREGCAAPGAASTARAGVRD